jgi:hypothetical protein
VFGEARPCARCQQRETEPPAGRRLMVVLVIAEDRANVDVAITPNAESVAVA